MESMALRLVSFSWVDYFCQALLTCTLWGCQLVRSEGTRVLTPVVRGFCAGVLWGFLHPVNGIFWGPWMDPYLRPLNSPFPTGISPKGAVLHHGNCDEIEFSSLQEGLQLPRMTCLWVAPRWQMLVQSKMVAAGPEAGGWVEGSW